MKKIILSLIAFLLLVNLQAQKVFTKTGAIGFSASSPLEKIEASTKKAVGVIDLASGRVEVQVLVKSLHFEKALMEEHFNENYMESGKFPDAKFVGNITDWNSVNLKKDGSYPVKIKGDMTMHGITKNIETNGTVIVKSGSVTASKADITIKIADFNIQIPGAVKDKIAKEAKINIDLALQPMPAAKAK